jgi:hypothetical protein
MPSGRRTRRQRQRQRQGQGQRQRQRQGHSSIVKPGPEGCHPRIGKSRPANGCFPTLIRRRLMTHKLSQGGGKNIACLKNHTYDRCLLEESSLSETEKTKIATKYLRPKRPSAWASDPDQWLDSNNIDSVMKQYEETYSDFKFLGVLPIDFAALDPYKKDGHTCLVDSICQLKLPELEAAGTRRLAAVFNLDPHFKDGSHWVATFVDLRPNIQKVYYFDSYGMEPPSQIAKFMRSLTLQDSDLELEYNARRFQFQGSECGMYSLYFIISMLEDESFKKFCHKAVPDGEMLRLRHWIFS